MMMLASLLLALFLLRGVESKQSFCVSSIVVYIYIKTQRFSIISNSTVANVYNLTVTSDSMGNVSQNA